MARFIPLLYLLERVSSRLYDFTTAIPPAISATVLLTMPRYFMYFLEPLLNGMEKLAPSGTRIGTVIKQSRKRSGFSVIRYIV